MGKNDVISMRVRHFSHLVTTTQDFADVIPGHGGLMDRFDCQMLMAFFANVYYLTFCRLVPAACINNTCVYTLSMYM